MPSGGADTATEAVTSAAILTLALEAAISPKMTRGTGWKQKGYVRGAQVRGQQKHGWAWVMTGWAGGGHWSGEQGTVEGVVCRSGPE